MGLFGKLFGGKKSKEADPPYPSWVINKDQIKMQEHFAILKAEAERKSIPDRFVQASLTTEYTQNSLLITAGLWESQGASFEEQTMAVWGKIERYWSNIDSNEKKLFLEEN